MSETTKDAAVPSVIMLPPVLLVLHLTAGFMLNWAFAGSMSRGWGWLGIVLLGAALYITNWSKTLFEKSGTPVPPNKPTTAIVTSGPYQYTRNPMYLCFMLWYMGMCFVAGAPLALFVALPLFYFLDQRIIVPEEKYLAGKFGDTYLEYKARVRRWV